MNDCIFCKIIKGEIPSKTIYENEFVLAFMEINPVSDGHILLIPKKHYTNFLDTPNETITEMYKVIKTKIYPLLKDKLNITGLSICQIGKDVKHYHMHLIPYLLLHYILPESYFLF